MPTPPARRPLHRAHLVALPFAMAFVAVSIAWEVWGDPLLPGLSWAGIAVAAYVAYVFWRVYKGERF